MAAEEITKFAINSTLGTRVNDPQTGYGIFIENMLDAAA